MISYGTVRLQSDVRFYHWSCKGHLNIDFTGCAAKNLNPMRGVKHNKSGYFQLL
jgi:hypothetical protein